MSFYRIISIIWSLNIVGWLIEDIYFNGGFEAQMGWMLSIIISAAFEILHNQQRPAATGGRGNE